MNPISVALDGLLAGLLLLALVVGLRLNGRLKALRESHLGFARSVADLDIAALRAEAALAALRQAGEETHDSLLARIEAARDLATRLEQLTGKAQAAEASLQARADTSVRDIPAREAPRRSAEAFTPREPAPVHRLDAARPPAPRRRPALEDELFETAEPRAAADDLSELIFRATGARR